MSSSESDDDSNAQNDNGNGLVVPEGQLDHDIESRLSLLVDSQEALFRGLRTVGETVIRLNETSTNLAAAIRDLATTVPTIVNRGPNFPAVVPATVNKKDQDIRFGDEGYRLSSKVRDNTIAQSKVVPLVHFAQTARHDSISADSKDMKTGSITISTKKTARFNNMQDIVNAIECFKAVCKYSPGLSQDAKDGARRIGKQFIKFTKSDSKSPELILWGWDIMMEKCNTICINDDGETAAPGYAIGVQTSTIEDIHHEYILSEFCFADPAYSAALASSFRSKRISKDSYDDDRDFSAQPCFKWNDGKCSDKDCSRRHVCKRCKGSHRFTACNTKKRAEDNNQAIKRQKVDPPKDA